MIFYGTGFWALLTLTKVRPLMWCVCKPSFIRSFYSLSSAATMRNITQKARTSHPYYSSAGTSGIECSVRCMSLMGSAELLVDSTLCFCIR